MPLGDGLQRVGALGEPLADGLGASGLAAWARSRAVSVVSAVMCWSVRVVSASLVFTSIVSQMLTPSLCEHPMAELSVDGLALLGEDPGNLIT